jgi:Right handed beta helix region
MARVHYKRMNSRRSACALIESLETRQLLAITTPLYVSPGATGSGNGSSGSPFTIAQAKTFVQNNKGTLTQDINIFMAPGRYYTPTGGYTFNSADSGNNGFRVIWQAQDNNNQPLLDAGSVVSGWSGTSGVVNAAVPINTFRDFYANDDWRPRARTTNTLVGMSWWWNNGVRSGIVINANDLPQTFTNMTEMEIHMPTEWKDFVIPITDITPASGGKRIIKLDQGALDAAIGSSTNGDGIMYDYPFWVENAFELLDQPGEWYLNEGQNRIYYQTKSGENPQSFTSWIPNQGRILSIDGASNLSFKGVGFTHVRNSSPNNFGAITYQATLWLRGVPSSAIYINNASNIAITDGKIVRCGGDGIDVNQSVNGLTITNMIFKDLGDVAINVGRQNLTGAARPNNVTFKNNVVYRVGRSYYSAPGIHFFQTTNAVIDNNHIQNVPYSGISIYNDSGGGSNTKIRNNKVIDTMRITRDGGGIYTFGPGGTSAGRMTISGNYIKNAFRDPGGIYLDQQSSYVDVTGNVLNGVSNWLYINNNANNIATSGNISTTSARTISGSVGANVVVGSGDPSVQSASSVQSSSISSNAGVEVPFRTGWVNGVPGGAAGNAPNGSAPSVSITGGGTVGLKDTNTTVQANVSDDSLPYDGYLNVLWRQVSGPSGGWTSFHHASNARTRVAFSLPGTYTLACDVSDGFATTTAQVTYTVTSQTLGTNLALASTATSSSNFGGNVASNVKDNNTSTVWAPGSGDEAGWWVKLDMGAARSLVRVEIVTRQSNVGYDESFVRRQFGVVGSPSDAAGSYSALGALGQVPMPLFSTWVLNVFDTTPFRYLMVRTSSPHAFVAAEIRVYSVSGTARMAPVSSPVEPAAGPKATVWSTTLLNSPGKSVLSDETQKISFFA